MSACEPLNLQMEGNAGLALTFDDAFIEEWFSARPIFQRFAVRATFFVCYPLRLSMRQLSMLKMLEMEGHEIGFHSLEHRHPVKLVKEIGPAGYLEQEILPGLAGMGAFGFSPTSFAYPFGARTPELDAALSQHFRILRGTCERPEEAIYPPTGNRLVHAVQGDCSEDDRPLQPLDRVLRFLELPRSSGGILAVHMHGVSDVPVPYGHVTTEELETFVTVASASGLRFVTISEMT